MLLIRFFRVGKKNQPSFKIVVIDRRKPAKAGPFVEEVGHWNPLTKDKVLRQERIKYWLSVGAKPSNTVRNLFISEKIIEGKKTPVHKKSKKKPTEGKPAEEKPTEVKPASPEVKPVAPETKPAEAPKPAEEKKEETPPPTEKK